MPSSAEPASNELSIPPQLGFAEIDGARLVPPRWFKLRIGPWPGRNVTGGAYRSFSADRA